MNCRLQLLRLRASTPDGMYGADVRFETGLNVLWADNTMGKSTCIQGMIYVLGLERMLSPRREIPLPHAMTSYLTNDSGKDIRVLQSDIWLELENASGVTITVHRPVLSGFDDRLITVSHGPLLTEPGQPYREQKFFVRDPGAAQREDGFHHFLEQFFGWRLPTVRGYEKDEIKLYLETVFPMFWVEQKSGWSSIPAAIPSYFRIKEVHKRAVEFILALDAYDLELQRERLNERLNALMREWEIRWNELAQHLGRSGARIDSLSQRPTADAESLANGFISVATQTGWIPLDEHLHNLRERLASLTDHEVPTVAENASAIEAQLAETANLADGLNRDRLMIKQVDEIKRTDIEALERRINTLKEDLAKNQDVQKLQRFSGVQWSLSPDRCPTCEQALHDHLLSQTALASIMPIEDNITYIKSELSMFEGIFHREKQEAKEREGRLAQLTRDLNDAYYRIRTLRADLVAPGGSASASVIQEKLVIERKMKDADELQNAFDQVSTALEELSRSYGEILKARSELPDDELSDSDKAKLTKLSELLRHQARQFGFSTFAPEELSISSDTYRPEKEGFEIGFETSASDAIRLKWAYQLALLETASTEPTNHPGLLVFDEPRQQSSSRISFEQLLRRAASSKGRQQQVIFSTSEDLKVLSEIIDSIDCTKIVFKGHILQPLG